MQLAEIVWDAKTCPEGNNPQYILGFVNGRCLFEIRVEGSRIFTYKLLTNPIKSDIFISGNTSKVLDETKYDHRNDAMIEVLKFFASCKLNEYVSLFEKKPQLYKVKLYDFNTAKIDQIVNGYLSYEEGRVAEYTRGEAIKKAQMFNGKIEKV